MNCFLAGGTSGLEARAAPGNLIENKIEDKESLDVPQLKLAYNDEVEEDDYDAD